MWPFNSSKSDSKDDSTLQSEDQVKRKLRKNLEALSASDKLSEEQKEILKWKFEANRESNEAPTISGHPNERLSIPLILRAPILMMTSFSAGFFLGVGVGGPKAAYRYRAENAHRMPTTQTGWFLYQKSKNYHAMLGGIKEGVKMGGVLTGWATLFMFTEETVDLARRGLFATGEDGIASGQRDAASTVVAAMSTAGIYSWKRGLDTFTAARTAKTAFKYSLIYGLVQDAAATLRGNRPAYVDWIARNTFGIKSNFDADEGIQQPQWKGLK